MSGNIEYLDSCIECGSLRLNATIHEETDELVILAVYCRDCRTEWLDEIQN